MPYQMSDERLSSRQSGNNKLHSMGTSLIRTTNAILSAIDEKKITSVILLEISKAFDKINCWILESCNQVLPGSPGISPTDHKL